MMSGSDGNGRPEGAALVTGASGGIGAATARAIAADGWPTLGEARGKVMFAMVNGEPYRSLYLEGHEGLAGRLIFTNAEPGQPDQTRDVLGPRAQAAFLSPAVQDGFDPRPRAQVQGADTLGTVELVGRQA